MRRWRTLRLVLTRPRTLVAAVALVGEIEAATRDGRIDREAKARMLGRSGGWCGWSGGARYSPLPTLPVARLPQSPPSSGSPPLRLAAPLNTDSVHVLRAVPLD